MNYFADTSYFLAVLNVRDINHDSAIEYNSDPDLRFTVTEFVFLELGNALSLSAGRKILGILLEHLRENPNITIIPLSSALMRKGEELFNQRPDKEWSLTDCISFVVMKEQKLSSALTSDHHFAQAGFKALLK